MTELMDVPHGFIPGPGLYRTPPICPCGADVNDPIHDVPNHNPAVVPGVDETWLDAEGDSSALWTLLTRDPQEHFDQEGISMWPMEEDEAAAWIDAIRVEGRRALDEMRAGLIVTLGPKRRYATGMQAERDAGWNDCRDFVLRFLTQHGTESPQGLDGGTTNAGS